MDLSILRLTYFLILKRRALALYSSMERSLTWYCQVRFVSILTPKYLTLLVGYSLLPYNFILIHLQVSFKDYNFSFFIKWRLLTFNQLTRCFKSVMTSLFSFLNELLRHNRFVSSAKWWTLQKFIGRLRSFIYNKNRKGPRADPEGHHNL